MAYSPPLRQRMPILLFMLLLLLLSPEPSKAQLFGLGPCPHYQSETLFTDQRIDKLKGSGRYSVLLSHNADLECMSFDFIDDVRLSFDFKDMRRQDPILQSERGRYIASPNLFRRRGFLKIDMERDGVLGCNPFGPVKLIPLLFTDTYEVWAACTSLLAVHFEHLFVLVHEPVSLRNDNVTKVSATSANFRLLNDVASLTSNSAHSLSSNDATSLTSNSAQSLSSNDVTSLTSNSAHSLPFNDVASLPPNPEHSLPSNDVTSLPSTSAHSSLLPSPSHNSIAINLGSVLPAAHSSGPTKVEGSIQDNSIKGTLGPAISVSKRDVTVAEGGLATRASRQTLAADIRDDLIGRGFPHANALRLKYDRCDD